MPAISVDEDPGRFCRAPGARLVIVEGCPVVQDPVDHAPRRLDGILAGEQRLVAARGVADQALVGRALGPALVAGEELDGLADQGLSGLLRPCTQRDRHVRRQPEAEVVGVRWLRFCEHGLGWTLQLHEHLGCAHGQALAGTEVERDAAPAPGVDVQAQRRERLDGRSGRDAPDLAIPAVLAAHHVLRRERPDRIEHLELPVPDRLRGLPRWGLHAEQAHDLEQVVLDHVPDRPRLVVEGPPVGHVEGLGHVDLHARDVIAVPERLEERVGEAEVEQVLNRLLAEIVVDPEDGRLGEDLVDRGVQGDGACQVAPEWLLEDDPRAGGGAGGRQVRDHLPEERGRDGQVVKGMPRVSELASQRVEGLDVVVRTLHVAQPRREVLDRRALDDAGSREALASALAEAVEVSRTGHADDRQVEALVAGQAEECREDLLEGQVARRPEEHERVGSLGGHAPSLSEPDCVSRVSRSPPLG